MKKKIKRNRVRCKKCYKVLESKHVHDFVICECPRREGAIFTDGGREYIRRGGNLDQMEDLTEYYEETTATQEQPNKGKKVLVTDDELDKYTTKALTFSKHPMFSSTRSTVHLAITEFLANEEGKTIYEELADK